MQCLHPERNTTCVSSCLSNCSGSRRRFSCSCNWGVFVVLHNRIYKCWCFLSFLLNRGITSNCSTCSTGCSRLSAIIRCTCSESALGRSIQNVQISRLSSILPAGFNSVSYQTQAPYWENTTVIPASFIDDSRNRLFDIGDLIRDPHNTVLGHVRDEFFTMMFKEFTSFA